MDNKSKYLGLAGTTAALAWLASMAGCTSDNGTDAVAGAGGSAASTAGAAGASGSAMSTAGASGSGMSTAGASGSAGSTGVAGAAGSASGLCASPTVIPSALPGIANFDGYDGVADIQKWSFNLGELATTGILAGTFTYGDRPVVPPATKEYPQLSEIGAGHASMYAFHIADAEVDHTPGVEGRYGGGMGLWLSNCIDGRAFTGISFWVKGSSPKMPPTAKFTLAMSDTTTNAPTNAGDKPGTCTGASMVCKHPSFDFAVTDTWTQIQTPWTGFVAGDANGTPVLPDGKNIAQVQFDIGLNYVPGPDGGAYVAVPAAYDLAIDDLTFY